MGIMNATAPGKKGDPGEPPRLSLYYLPIQESRCRKIPEKIRKPYLFIPVTGEIIIDKSCDQVQFY
jgi:hypothetical protein